MPFVPNPVPQVHAARVITPATIRASRRGGRWLLLFLLAVVVLAVGAASAVLPLARVTLVPVLEPVLVQGNVRVDVDASTAVPSSGVIPGRILGTGDTIAMALRGSATVRLIGAIATYTRSEADAVVMSAATRAAGDGYVVLQPLPGVVWGEPQPTPSGRGALLPFSLTVQRYHQFPLPAWRDHLATTDLAEARDWLLSQPGVAGVTISFSPDFLASFSQKLPKLQRAISFSLDIAGKTSILE